MSQSLTYDTDLADIEGGSFGDYLDALKRRKKSAIIIALTVLILGTTITVLLPNSYESTATILIEQPEVPPGLIPTTVTTLAAQQLQYISQRVMTRTNLAGIIEKFDLYQDERRYLPTLMLVDEVRDYLRVDLIDVAAASPSGQPITSTIAFTLGFEHENPKTAQSVTNELVSLYLGENVRTRTVQTAETSEFVQNEVDRLDREVRAIEKEVAAYKAENEGSLPEQMQLNMQLLERNESEIMQLQRQLESVAEARILITAELAQVEPVAPSILADGRAVVSPADQLKAAQTQLAVLEGRYSPSHPDVMRVKREIKALEAQLGISGIDFAQNDAALSDARSELAKAKENYADEHPEVKRLERVVASLEQRVADSTRLTQQSLTDQIRPDNPAYIQLSTQLKTLAADERALRRQIAEMRARSVDFEEKLMRSSEVERELSSMIRRLSTSTSSYLAARDKLFSAKMGQALETQSKGERFTLVEPADLPLEPSSPNRPVLMALVIILALAGGLGWPQVAATMDQSVRGARSIERIFGAPPIGEIPMITTAADIRQGKRARLMGLVIVPVAIALIFVAIHFLFMPLDVLWYVAVRRLGL